MPLTRREVDDLKPWRVFLGHIHKPSDLDLVTYPGSPCGLDINETGRRRFISFDTLTGATEAVEVDSDILFFNESLLVVPHQDEGHLAGQAIDDMIARWNLNEGDRDKAVIRVTVSGYITDIRRLSDILAAGLSGFRFFKDEGSRLSDVRLAEDEDRAQLAGKVRQAIADLGWRNDPDGPSEEEIHLEALKVIYGDS